MSSPRPLLIASGNMRYGRPQLWDVPNPAAPPRLPTTLFVDRVRQLDVHVLLVQEVLEHHIPAMRRRLGMSYVFFAPMHHADQPPSRQRNRLGLAIFSRLPFGLEPGSLRQIPYAHFNKDNPDDWNSFDYAGRPLDAVYQEAVVTWDGQPYRLGNTHFTWSPGGVYSAKQRAALRNLVRIIGPGRPVVWGADTNMPRGSSDGWNVLKSYWTDNIPAHITNSLDPVYHPVCFRDGRTFMLDGLFSHRYQVTNVQLHGGVSSHQLITAAVLPQ
jgi:hypothetical protein